MIWTICTLPCSECSVLSQSTAVFIENIILQFYCDLILYEALSVLGILKPAVLKTCFLQVLPMYTY
jgi:hypothetical protein